MYALLPCHLPHDIYVTATTQKKKKQRMRDMWLQESSKDEPNLDVKFQYALTLIKTRSHDKNREGMSLLEGEH